MNSYDPIPDGAYLMTVTCSKCGQKFQSWTEANMSDPETAAMVERLMAVTTCDRCKAEAAPTNFRPPWEQARLL